ncbi:MAG: hypothetical protein R2711_04050 [Acidimicrobiales bacterium]
MAADADRRAKELAPGWASSRRRDPRYQEVDSSAVFNGHHLAGATWSALAGSRRRSADGTDDDVDWMVVHHRVAGLGHLRRRGRHRLRRGSAPPSTYSKYQGTVRERRCSPPR